MESYGGSISVESRVGQGTCFTIDLPLARPESRPTAAGTADEQEDDEPRGRVLVVDDEPRLRGAVARLLGEHDVVQAGSGAAAMELLHGDQRFDVILCDMMMPEVSGMDLHQWLCEEHPPLAERVIFITGGAFTPRARDFLSRVDNLQLEKPFDPNNLKKIVIERVLLARRT